MKKILISVVLIICTVLLISGCQNETDIPEITKPDIELTDVSVNSNTDYITFDYQVPKEWISNPSNNVSVTSISPKNNNSEFKLNPYVLTLEYATADYPDSNQTQKQACDALFGGDPRDIEQVIKDEVEYVNAGIYLEKNSEAFKSENNTSSFLDYFNAIAGDAPEATEPEGWNDKVWATDFKYSSYPNEYGKIVAVEYTYNIEDKSYKAINCYREDGCIVKAAYDESLNVSSGDLARWTIKTAKITINKNINE